MKELLTKKRRGFKIFSIFSIVIVVATLSCPFLFAATESDAVFGLMMVLTFAAFALYIVFFNSFYNFCLSDKMLKKNGMENIADDVSLEQPTLPKSKIYCGKYALCSKKPVLVIPYSEIAWVYVNVQKLYGVVTVSKTVVIACRNGRRFSLKADMDEFQWLLQTYLLKVNPNIIVGFGRDQQKAFKQVCKDYKKNK